MKKSFLENECELLRNNMSKIIKEKSFSEMLSFDEKIDLLENDISNQMKEIVETMNSKKISEVWESGVSEIMLSCDIENGDTPFSNNGKMGIYYYLEKVLFEGWDVWGIK